MYPLKKRMIINDIKANKLVNAATCIFMTLTAMLLGLSIFLFTSLAGSIDTLMAKAQTPDFLQMHTGDLDEEALTAFSGQRKDVDRMQICDFLNLPNSQLSIGNHSLENNMQDNGLCCQSPLFDYLVNSEYKVIHPSRGQVYVPVCYKKEYGLNAGDLMRIGRETLTVAGFLRDSQMNSMMASSKRFLVSQADYERLKSLGSQEYLIEFKLKEGSDINAFATAYKDAGLPDNGPTITYPLIRMMNALSDGMMILVILLVSFLVLFISILCIRYIILTQLEKDKRDIGMLKALGISRRGIRSLYFYKYLLLSAAACFTGIILAMILAKPLGTQIRDLYGHSGKTGPVFILTILGTLTAEGIILLSVHKTLIRMDKMTTIEALFGKGVRGKKKNLWLPAMIITAAATFMILLPWNIKSTIEDPEFVTYMGIGQSQIRIDIRQTENAKNRAAAVKKEIEADRRVADHVLMQTASYKTLLPDGTSCNLIIEKGDHSKFPVRYIEGRYPEKSGEIALSVLNAQSTDLKLGDSVLIYKKGNNGKLSQVSCTICGIYSDITNGGKTAKACLEDSDDNTPVMWGILYLSLGDETLVGEWTREYQKRYASFGVDFKVTLISDYLRGTYGQTIKNISKASALSAAISCLILFVVMLLLTRLVIWRERKDSALKKALGFTSPDIRKEYLKKAFGYILAGIITGIFSGLIPGQRLAAMLLKSMGAYSFHFIINPAIVYAAIPAMIEIAALAGAIVSLREVRNIHAYECL